MKTATGRTRRRLLVIAAVVGATAFGLLLGYLAYANDSFPTKEKPFGDYATVASSVFNGTEYDFHLQWVAGGNYTPLYAQLTSPTSDAANSPVCEVGLGPVVAGQAFDLPFAIASPATGLSNVDLYIAVQSNTNMSQFTIHFHVDSVSAQPGIIEPSQYACAEPQGANM
jgi:hypothetical protein